MATARQLFDDLVVSDAHDRRRRSRASLPVSLALHGSGVAVLLALPAFAPLELPGGPPSGPVVFRLPQPVPIAQAATRPLPARPPGVSRARSAAVEPALRAATQAAPRAVPAALPVPDDAVSAASLDLALPFGAGCNGPGCVPGLAGSVGPSDVAGVGPAADAAGSGRVLVSGRDVSPPVKLHDARPVYPDLARRARVAGVVVIACTIAPDGRVADARLVSGPPLLDAAALEAVRQWRYRPTLVGGTPVAVLLTVTVHFRLER